MRTPAVSGQSSDARASRGRTPRVLAQGATPNAKEQAAKELEAKEREMPESQSHALDALLDLCARYMPPADLDLIRAAYATAAEAHAGVRRKSGEPFIEHPVAVARILAELAIDAPGIAAALLHDTVEDTGVTLELLHDRFGPAIAGIVDGVTKFSAVEAPKVREDDEGQTARDGQPSVCASAAEPHGRVDPVAASREKAQLHAETVHKLFLAMLQDPRVVLLKLADRLHNMRTMEVMSARQREVKSREVLDIYAPLAGRIGLYTFKGELEDLAFAYLYPAEYRRVARLLEAEAERRGEWAERMCQLMRDELAASGISAATNWRTKRAYRAWIEAQESGMRESTLNDLITFRVIVATVGECYRALGQIHRLWQPFERIRDYIATAKNNGYQSLHTAVFALEEHLAQIHIRTHKMHRAAQHGVTAYWLERAAQGGRAAAGDSLVRQMPSWVSQLRTWENDLKLSAVDFLATIRDEVLDADSVFVFTPRGDVYELPAGATVLDLAYRIHTRIGDQATGAQIQTASRDGTLVAREAPIDYALQTGDVVLVTTDARSRPRQEWREMVITRYAREKIARSLRVMSRAQPGAGAAPSARDAEHDDDRENDAAVSEPAAESEPNLPVPLRHPSGRTAEVRLGHCCYPCPGDAIVGLADDRRGVTVHRGCCRTLRHALRLRAARAGSTATPLPVRWEELGPLTYRLHLAIYGQDHRGLMHEVSACIATLGLNMTYTRALANQDRWKAAIILTLDMPPRVRRDTVLRRLRAVPGVTLVKRETRKGCDEAQDLPEAPEAHGL
jgi:GTP pyrophosphokinase